MKQNTNVSPYKMENEEVLFLLRYGILSVPHGRSKSLTPCHVQIFSCALTRCVDAKNIMLTIKPLLQSVRIPTTLLGNHFNLVSHCFDGLAQECTNTNTNTMSQMYMP